MDGRCLQTNESNCLATRCEREENQREHSISWEAEPDLGHTEEEGHVRGGVVSKEPGKPRRHFRETRASNLK